MSTNSTTKPTEAIPTLRLKPRGMELRSRSAVLEADDGENQMEDMTDILDDDVDKSPSQSQQSAVALPPPTAKRPLLGETTKSFTTSVTPATRDLSEKEKANLSKLNLLCLPKSATSANFRKGSIVNDAIIADFLITLRADLDDVTSRHAAQVKVFHSSIADLHLPGNGLIDESLNRLFKRVKALEESATQMVDAYEGSFDEIADLNKSYAAHSAKSARTQDQVTALADRIQAVEDTFTRTVVTPIPKPRTFPVRQVGLASTAIPSPIARPVASSSGTSAPVTSTIRRNGPTAPPPAKRARGNDGQSALSRTNMVRLKLRYPQKDIKAAAMVLMRFLPASMSSSIATVWHTKEPLYVTIRFRGSPFGSAHEAAARYVSLFDLGPPDARLEGMDAELWENSPSGARVEEMGGDLENDDAFEALTRGSAPDSSASTHDASHDIVPDALTLLHPSPSTPASTELASINSVPPVKPYLTFMSWNIHGELMLRLRDQEWLDIVTAYDVIALQETWLLENHESAMRWPTGYKCYVSSRPEAADMRRRGGGVAVLVREGIPHVLCPHMTWPDILTLDFGCLYLVCSYVAPSTSDWSVWTDVEPMERVEEVVSFCCSSVQKGTLWVGDLNARTANRSTHPNHPRLSLDSHSTARGSDLVAFCEELGLVILNGTSREDTSPGTWTSFQEMGTSVIDYAIVSQNILPIVKKMHVWREEDGHSDHAIIEIHMDLPPVSNPPGRRRKIPIGSLESNRERPLPSPRDPLTQQPIPHSELDLLLEHTLTLCRTGEEACADLYGCCYFDERPITAWTDGSCHRNGTEGARAGAGVFWGDGNPGNISVRVPGGQTNTRGEHLAVLIAVRDADPRRKLIIYSDNEGVIRTYCFWLDSFAARGWHCANEDLIRNTATLLEQRPGRVEFRWVKGHSGNHGNDGADGQANDGAGLPDSDAFELPVPIPLGWEPCYDRAPLPGPKVFTHLPASPMPSSSLADSSMPEDAFGRDSHRGRDRTRLLQANALRDFMANAQRHDKPFWANVRELLDPKNPPIAVPLPILCQSFERRLNPPDTMPDHFDADRLAEARLETESIPMHTEDRTASNLFSQAFDLTEIAWAKQRLRDKGSTQGTPGFDGTTYKTFSSLPNEALVTLFNRCIELLDAPHLWLSTILAGILKVGKPADDAESYRLVGLESCLLKMLTLLIDKRFRLWAEEEGVLPDSQNGFRTGYRTNNNVFILRCAIERARANGTPLYVVFLDLSNAFPSTDLPSLWSQLYSMGVSGPIFDWLRVLYARMTYMVRKDGEYSKAFFSEIGVLTGDTASPTLWNLFMSDLRIPTLPGDIFLAGRAVTNVEQADDCAIWSTDLISLQRHIEIFEQWCRRKGLTISVVKTKAMCFGRPPPAGLASSSIVINGRDIEWVRAYKYVGIILCSTAASIFADNYTAKARSAQRVANVTLACEAVLGNLPPKEGCLLYKARIEPLLTAGFEAVIDVSDSDIVQLEKVQIRYIRRLLRLQKRSMRWILYTETGLPPIRHRRLLLVLRFLLYLIPLTRSHLVRCAFDDSLDLARNGKGGWVGDLANALYDLDQDVRIVWNFREDITPATVERLEIAVKESYERQARNALDASHKTWLLHNRVEYVGRGRTDTSPLLLRHYLRHITIPSHRIAFTRLLLSCHGLAVERLRWATRARPTSVPREDRLCRFCNRLGMREVEDETHAMLGCTADPRLVELRSEMWGDSDIRGSGIRAATVGLSENEVLRELIRRPEVVKRMGKYIFQVLNVFADEPMFTPDANT